MSKIFVFILGYVISIPCFCYCVVCFTIRFLCYRSTANESWSCLLTR